MSAITEDEVAASWHAGCPGGEPGAVWGTRGVPSKVSCACPSPRPSGTVRRILPALAAGQVTAAAHA